VHLLSIVQDLTEDLPGAELVQESAGEGEKRGTMVRQDAGEDIAGHERHSTIGKSYMTKMVEKLKLLPATMAC
jgi:hypothetical protein